MMALSSLRGISTHMWGEGGAKAPGNQNLHGRLLLEMVQNNDLFFPSLNSISSGPAYTCFRGETLSITDYIITDARHVHLTIQCQTFDHHPLNFSDHLPLSLTLSIMSNSNSTLSTSRSKPRLNWHAASADGSAEAYAKCVDEIVQPYLCRTYNSIYSLDKDILHGSLYHTSSSCLINYSHTKAEKV